MPWAPIANLQGPAGESGDAAATPAGTYSGTWVDAGPSVVNGETTSAGMTVDGTPRVVADITQPVIAPTGCELAQGGVIRVRQSGVWAFNGSAQYNANTAVRAVYFVVGTNPAGTPKYGLFGTASADSMATAATMALSAGDTVSLCTQRWSGSNLVIWKAQGCTISATWLGDPRSVTVPPSQPVIATLTDAASIATDASRADTFRVSISGNRTLAAPSNPTDGQRAVWQVTASGAQRSLSLATGTGGFAFGSAITALSPIASGKTDHIGAIYHAPANRWHVLAYAKGY